jgi:hypothetical protein
MAIGYSEELSATIIDTCKATAKNPRHCVITAAFIGFAESTSGRRDAFNNVFGFRNRKFESEALAMSQFTLTYNRVWYRTVGPIDFYSPVPGLPKTRFCVDEYQKDGRKLHYCPNGYKNSSKAFNLLIQSK